MQVSKYEVWNGGVLQVFQTSINVLALKNTFFVLQSRSIIFLEIKTNCNFQESSHSGMYVSIIGCVKILTKYC
jgi:hypothetical protein